MSVFLILALVATVPQQTDGQRTAKDAAAAFTLDSVTPSPSDASTTAAAAAATAPPAVGQPATLSATSPAPTESTARHSSPSWLDIPIASLIANPTTKAVLDRDLPGLTADSNLAKFQGKSLREFQPLTGGQLTDAMLQKVEADIAVAPPPPPAVKNRRGER